MESGGEWWGVMGSDYDTLGFVELKKSGMMIHWIFQNRRTREDLSRNFGIVDFYVNNECPMSLIFC